MKLAIKNGTPIVPMYGFGETSLFRQVRAFRSPIRGLTWACQ